VRDGWNEPFEPFRVFGDTCYVGTASLSAVLIASDARRRTSSSTNDLAEPPEFAPCSRTRVVPKL
jgi:hypothetical protein